jgi:hypothetical protein
MSRAFRLHLLQAVGLPLIAIVPAAALAGLLDPVSEAVTTRPAGIELEVHYPTRLRHEQLRMEMTVRNVGEESSGNLRIVVDRAYTDRFADPSFHPAISQVTDDAYVADVGNLQGGDTRMVVLHAQAEAHGTNRGWVEIRSETGTLVHTDIKTLVLP